MLLQNRYVLAAMLFRHLASMLARVCMAVNCYSSLARKRRPLCPPWRWTAGP